MRFVIDMQGAQTESRFRGIGRYTIAFAKAVVRNRGDHEIILALSGLLPDAIESIRAEFDGLLDQDAIRVWQALGPVREVLEGTDENRVSAEYLREAFLASLKPDVVHITSLFEGFIDDAVTSIGAFDKHTAVSVILYDLIPMLNPDQYLKPNPFFARYYNRKIDHLKKASCFLAISESAKEEGLSYLPVDAARISNISTAISDEFKPLAVEEEIANALRKQFGLDHPFVLYTGGADERKNLPRLIEAYAKLPAWLRKGHQVLFAGRMSDEVMDQLRKHAADNGLSSHQLCFTGYISDETLLSLYNLCKLFVFPSWHEGFGLPALEAMACGVPVITANTSSLPEVVGISEAMFDPLDVSSIAKKMAEALEDQSFRDRLIDNGLRRAKLFSWDETAKRAITAWENIEPLRLKNKEVLSLSKRRPRLAFVSPLPPERTGIADYSAELLPALSAHYEIDCVVPQSRTDLPPGFSGKVRDVAWLRQHAGEIDRVLYQVGNSPFHEHMSALMREIPGSVVLHDFYLSGLMSWLELHGGQDGAWVQSLYESHGYAAVRDRFVNPEAAKYRYPANLQVLQYAQGVIVHSNYSRQLASDWYGKHAAEVDWVTIPLLRTAAQPFDSDEVRAQLGFGVDDFVICSFGFVDPSKLNHRLLNGWINSALAADQRCHLVFVGQNHGGDYGAELLKTIKDHSLQGRVKITGFVEPGLFRDYLMSADMAVQLRTYSRGETSAAVLDCMNYCLPVVVNSHGSMAELDPQSVSRLPDEFTDAELITVLEKLWKDPAQRASLGGTAKEHILRDHAPDVCAAKYTKAIERFHRQGLATVPALVEHISSVNPAELSAVQTSRLAQAIALNHPLIRSGKRLFLDITATCRQDLKTGIERVARALAMALLENSPAGYRIEPVYLSDVGRRWHYRFARQYTLGLLGCQTANLADEVVDPQVGDYLLTLDLSGETLVEAAKSGLFKSMQSMGVRTTAMVFDLLPVTLPEVFPPGTNLAHSRWLEAVAQFDGAICISKSVADDLHQWLTTNEAVSCRQNEFAIDWFHLGADISSSAPSLGLPAGAKLVLDEMASRPTFLMVGTIEPRKGYLEVLEAFECLWQAGHNVNLVIVGREGWIGLPEDMRRDIPKTVSKIRQHAKLNRCLFWLEGISDEFLAKVYEHSDCLIAASYGEGFGLPLIEAAQHQLPVLARDIPVFREVAGDSANYFVAGDPKALADALITWLESSVRSQVSPTLTQLPHKSWAESAKMLSSVLKLTAH